MLRGYPEKSTYNNPVKKLLFKRSGATYITAWFGSAHHDTFVYNNGLICSTLGYRGQWTLKHHPSASLTYRCTFSEVPDGFVVVEIAVSTARSAEPDVAFGVLHHTLYKSVVQAVFGI
ncbi:hypothetical protein BH09BAC1_BH09BAC1_03700 [soil metagenome]